MAVAFTVTNVHSVGNLKQVHGTFTSADGDNTATLDSSTHGFNYIADYDITINSGGVGVQEPKVTISSGTITAVWDDTQGYSGTFSVTGR